MVAHLEKKIFDDEVKSVWFQMQPNTASRLNGMTPLFFQKIWDIVDTNIINEVQSFFASRKFLRQLNYTYVCLIPKKKRSKEMSHLRPISLCSVLTKIVSKVLANRLKLLLSSLISQHQTSFVLGCQISNNSIIAYEIINALSNRRMRKNGFLSFKLDMSKAYDRIEWLYLHKVLTKMGFPPCWINFVMATVTSVCYSFLVNGCPRAISNL